MRKVDAPGARDVLFDLFGDSHLGVGAAAIETLGDQTLGREDLERLESSVTSAGSNPALDQQVVSLMSGEGKDKEGAQPDAGCDPGADVGCEDWGSGSDGSGWVRPVITMILDSLGLASSPPLRRAGLRPGLVRGVAAGRGWHRGVRCAGKRGNAAGVSDRPHNGDAVVAG
jgi:hypothetical protein